MVTFKEAPVLLLSFRTNRATDLHRPLIVVPLTTEIKKTDMPTHYVLRHQRGLDKPCMALAEQIQTIRKSQIIRYLGHVRPIHMSCIDLGIRESIGLPPQHIIRIIPPNEQKE